MNYVWNVSDNLKVLQYPMPAIDSNMYIIVGETEALIIDPNVNLEAIELLKKIGIEKCQIVLSHGHFDHISGVNFFRENFKCNVICSEKTSKDIVDPGSNLAKYWEFLVMDKSDEIKDIAVRIKDEDYSCYADEALKEDTTFEWTGHTVRFLLAPGHSAGSMLIFVDNVLFTGDSLVNGAGVNCVLPGGSWKIYQKVTKPIIEKISDDKMIFPGHGCPDKMCNLRKYLAKFGKV